MTMNRGGFTILETMIVLAVSGSILVASIAIFGSQQRRQQYANATKDIEIKVQDVMNDVATGNYEAANSSTCIPDDINGPQFDTSVPKTSGTNQGCIFMGKAIQFQKTQMVVMTLVGNRFKNGKPAATFKETQPVVDPSSVTIYEYQYGLEVYSVEPDRSALIVFATTPNNTGFIGGNPDSGFQSGTQLVLAITSSQSGDAAVELVGTPFAVDSINTVLQKNNFANNTLSKVTFCLQDNASVISGRQYSGIIISGGSSSLTVQREGDKVEAVC